MTPYSIRELAGNTIFSATFTKKDGSERKMLCRLNVRKDLKDIGHKFDADKQGLLCVYDMINKGYRFVNLNTTTELKIKGKTYLVNNQI
jgi:hypothetical protein